MAALTGAVVLAPAVAVAGEPTFTIGSPAAAAKAAGSVVLAISGLDPASPEGRWLRIVLADLDVDRALSGRMAALVTERSPCAAAPATGLAKTSGPALSTGWKHPSSEPALGAALRAAEGLLAGEAGTVVIVAASGHPPCGPPAAPIAASLALRGVSIVVIGVGRPEGLEHLSPIARAAGAAGRRPSGYVLVRSLPELREAVLKALLRPPKPPT